MKNKKVYLIVGIVIIGIILFIFISHKWDGIVNKEINNKIESIGGQVENIEKIDVSKTPFKKDNVGGYISKSHTNIKGNIK
ncbi:hypothetical protein H1230_12440 [Paenibacillus sp. 19GGS1-52]|uniref:hypothetical protein n=1 Tax=Paenibacillus sp. 19GGS1-52 TaxID=2758563 RepID=UPI001EFBFB5B|nr:hypothetical protein [Paenibacillus sp. 19GGS1-52]ULO09506.1 hypothetical protein H1230_12440 [Paenibacillus sp. 19GGS1-52]